MKNKLKLEIEILKIDVEDREFEIHYRYSFDEGEWKTDIYGSDYDNGSSPKKWKKELENGIALQGVLQRIAEDNY